MKYFVISWKAADVIRRMLLENVDDCTAVEPEEIMNELVKSLRKPTELTYGELCEEWTKR